MSKAQKMVHISSIDGLNDGVLMSPAEAADFIGISRGTCKSYLDGHSDVLPPIEVGENGYRKYGKDTIKRLLILKTLRAKPFSIPIKESSLFLEEIGVDAIWRALSISNSSLIQLLVDKGYFNR